MDNSDDHALLCRRDPYYARFHHCHRPVEQTLGLLLRQAGITHVIEAQYLRLLREGSGPGRGSGLTRLADILLYG